MGAPRVRRTRQRDLVLEAVRTSNDHPTAAQVFERVRRRHPRIAFATIYNSLRWWVEQGELRDFTFGDAATRYDRNSARHDHVICTACGKLTDARFELPAQVRQAIRRQTGMTITSHHIQFLGLCAMCAKTRAKRSGAKG